MNAKDFIQAIAEAKAKPENEKLPKGHPLVGTIKNGRFVALVVKK